MKIQYDVKTAWTSCYVDVWTLPCVCLRTCACALALENIYSSVLWNGDLAMMWDLLWYVGCDIIAIYFVAGLLKKLSRDALPSVELGKTRNVESPSQQRCNASLSSHSHGGLVCVGLCWVAVEWSSANLCITRQASSPSGPSSSFIVPTTLSKVLKLGKVSFARV